MRTAFIALVAVILISCKSKKNNQIQAVHRFKFGSVIVDSAHLFKDSAFRPEDYFENKFDYGYHISLVRLIATPEVYHNKRVGVKGFYHFAIEESTLYLSEDDAKQSNGKNGVFVNFGENPDFNKVVDNFQDKYVIIYGVFDMHSTGHAGFNSGGINNISRIYLSNY